MDKYIRHVTDIPIKNPKVAAVFGHLIKLDRQVHDFQYTVIKAYLGKKNIPDALAVVKDVIFETERAVSHDEALLLLRAEAPQVQRELVEALALVGAVDGITDKNESVYLDELTARLSDKDELRRCISSGRQHAERIRKQLKKNSSKDRNGKKSSRTDNLFRISQREYLSAITGCRETAYKDFAVIKPICDETISAAQALVNRLNSEAVTGKSSSKEQEISQLLKSFAKSTSDSILASAKEYRTRLERKEMSLEDFTIVLVGRTKAGKSTLKAVLTGSGKDEIGKGKQRTTLVNYIYEWNSLRIIDTPGIDAGGDIEQADKAIAEKALSQADVVCYLSPSDGVPKGTKAFIGEIVSSNKPVLLVLNYKNNIRDEDNLEDFLDDPDEWRSDKGSNSINGYFEPIRRYAQENGFQEMISYYPVFLLAALMSEEEKYKQYASVLRKNSGIDEFLASLKIIVAEQGTFLRSKTIIDDTICICNEWQEKFAASLQKLKDARNSLDESKKQTFVKLDDARKRFMHNSERAIQQEFRTLITKHAKRFAEDNYKMKKGVTEAWQRYCDKIGFQGTLSNAVETESAAFTETISSIFDDLSDDLDFVVTDCGGISAGMNLFPVRELTRFIGGALGIAGAIVLISNPIGWAFAGAGLLVGIISGFFKKKADRIKSAQDKLYNKMKESIEAQMESTLEAFRKDAGSATEKAVSKAKKMYKELSNCLKRMIDESTALQKKWQAQTDSMDLAFAQRIMEYIAPRADYRILRVERTYGEHIAIFLDKEVNADTAKLNGLIRDRVTIAKAVPDDSTH